MSDEQQDLNLEDVGAGAEEAGGPKKGGVFSGLLLTILKWAAIGIGVIILVVTTTVVTVGIAQRGSSQQNLAANSPAYRSKAEPLAYYELPNAIRGGTVDETPAIFVVRLRLGYEMNAKEVSAEIGMRVPEIEDIILKYVSQKTAAELSPQHYNEIQSELLNMINRIMSTGKIKSVVFREFSVVK